MCFSTEQPVQTHKCGNQVLAPLLVENVCSWNTYLFSKSEKTINHSVIQVGAFSCRPSSCLRRTLNVMLTSHFRFVYSAVEHTWMFAISRKLVAWRWKLWIIKPLITLTTRCAIYIIDREALIRQRRYKSFTVGNTFKVLQIIYQVIIKVIHWNSL